MNLAILGSRGFPSTYGGYETLVRYLARWLVARDHRVTVYCRTRDEDRREWITENVLCVASGGLETKSLSTLSHGATASLHAARSNYDAMLILNIANGFYLPWLRSRGIPTAVNTDGLEWERGKWGRVARLTFLAGAALSAKHATELIVDSEAIGGIWKERFGAKSTFIPYGAPVVESIDTEGLDVLGVEAGKYLLVVARLTPENNVELALDALEILGDAAPRTLLVGTANSRSPIEARVKRLHTAGRIRWLGHVRDQSLLTRLWRNAGIYFHGHSVGGTNPALLQALGAGAPVLALDTPFNREVIRAPEQLVPPDARFLARHIKELQTSDTVRAGFSTHGQAVVAQHYKWDDVCARYYALLNRIASVKAG